LDDVADGICEAIRADATDPRQRAAALALAGGLFSLAALKQYADAYLEAMKCRG